MSVNFCNYNANLVLPGLRFKHENIVLKPNRRRSFKTLNSLSGNNDRNKPVVILPGLGNSTADYEDLSIKLSGLGLSPVTAQVSRPDWLRNAAGLVDPNYWKGTLKPRPILDWYLERVENAIKLAKDRGSDSSKVSLIGHSAGGWLARLFLYEFGTEDVELLVTLGTPHLPPPQGIQGVVDQTRGLLYHIEENFPGAFHSEVKYVCVAGRYLKGARFIGNTKENEPGQESSLDESLTETPTFREKVVGQGYKQVCGQSDVWGDGVVPEVSAFLEGAINISLDGVYHSPVGASESRPWYGSPGVLEKWVNHLIE